MKSKKVKIRMENSTEFQDAELFENSNHLSIPEHQEMVSAMETILKNGDLNSYSKKEKEKLEKIIREQLKNEKANLKRKLS